MNEQKPEQPNQLEREEMMREIVGNYNKQVKMVGGKSGVTLEAYIRGIQTSSPSISDEDVAYAIRWAEEARENENAKTDI